MKDPFWSGTLQQIDFQIFQISLTCCASVRVRILGLGKTGYGYIGLGCLEWSTMIRWLVRKNIIKTGHCRYWPKHAQWASTRTQRHPTHSVSVDLRLLTPKVDHQWLITQVPPAQRLQEMDLSGEKLAESSARFWQLAVLHPPNLVCPRSYHFINILRGIPSSFGDTPNQRFPSVTFIDLLYLLYRCV